MPSSTFSVFRDLLVDVDRLIESHQILKGDKGRQGLGHITRSGVLMLCAAWELFNEELVLESIRRLSVALADPSHLPQKVRKTISEKVRKDKHELKPIELCGDGWKQVWFEYAKIETELLNTPKSEKLHLLFQRYVGVETYKDWLDGNENKIDHFVSTRGEIAHKGRKASYVRMTALRQYYDLVLDCAINIDSEMALFISAHTSGTRQPWNRTYTR